MFLFVHKLKLLFDFLLVGERHIRCSQCSCLFTKLHPEFLTNCTGPYNDLTMYVYFMSIQYVIKECRQGSVRQDRLAEICIHLSMFKLGIPKLWHFWHIETILSCKSLNIKWLNVIFSVLVKGYVYASSCISRSAHFSQCDLSRYLVIDPQTAIRHCIFSHSSVD